MFIKKNIISISFKNQMFYFIYSNILSDGKSLVSLIILIIFNKSNIFLNSTIIYSMIFYYDRKLGFEFSAFGVLKSH
jgi:Na+-driven multidrug efflux pump